MTINYKVFAAGDTLSANDVLTYLENQAVIKVDAASELPTLASTYPNVKVAYAADTDKVYVNDDGTYVALVTADGTVTLSNLTLTGNLTVQGTTTTIDSTTIAIKDKFVFEGSTADAHETTLQVVEPTADRTISLPDSSGTVALTSDIPSVASFITASSADNLTNKTLNLASNTVSSTLAQLNTAISDADIASLAGAETLTNKTISGATNTLTNIGNASLTNSSITINGTPVSLGGTTTISSYSLPPQTGNSGKFLTTNGTTDSWGTVDLSGKVDKTTLTTTGDIFYASSANTPARLGIGSTGQVLTVASGIPSWATPAGGGKVLQMVVGTTTTSVDSYSTTYVDTNLTATITPISATSKILILGQQSFWTANHGDIAGSCARIVRNSTVINQRDNFGAIEAGRTSQNIVAFNFTWGIVYLDSPNTTSATTYKTQFRNAVTPVGWASSVNPFGTPAQIILLEIGA